MVLCFRKSQIEMFQIMLKFFFFPYQLAKRHFFSFYVWYSFLIEKKQVL